MKRTIILVAGLTLASGVGFAQQQQETQEYDPDRDISTQTERDRDMGMDQQRPDTPVESDWGTEPTEPESDYETGMETESDPTQTERDYGTQQGQTGQQQTGQTGTQQSGLSDLTAEELRGQTIVTADGEEIGEINEVGYSSTHQERVATVEVGGFLGVGQKQIAIPLSKIQKSVDDPSTVQTSMTRESIESEEEFDETGFEVGQGEQQ